MNLSARPIVAHPLGRLRPVLQGNTVFLSSNDVKKIYIDSDDDREL